MQTSMAGFSLNRLLHRILEVFNSLGRFLLSDLGRRIINISGIARDKLSVSTNFGVGAALNAILLHNSVLIAGTE